MDRESIILNKYGALDTIELKELYDRIEDLETKVRLLAKALDYDVFGLDMDCEGGFENTFKKIKYITKADDYEFVTETKLIKKKEKTNDKR